MNAYVTTTDFRDVTTGAWWQPILRFFHHRWFAQITRDAAEIGKETRKAGGAIVNVGGGVGERWPDAVSCDAKWTPDLDFNTCALPYADGAADLTVCEQVIEHLHNTRWFLRELFRVTKPGGRLLLATENLASLPNIAALLLGRTPFSLQSCSGVYCGGWKAGPVTPEDMRPLNHPTHSGCKGHVRVLTFRQAKWLLCEAGFEIESARRYGMGFYMQFVAVRPDPVGDGVARRFIARHERVAVSAVLAAGMLAIAAVGWVIAIPFRVAGWITRRTA